MTRRDQLVKRANYAVRAKGNAMRRPLNKVPSIPDAEWINPDNRFAFFERVLREREPGNIFRPDRIVVRMVQKSDRSPMHIFPSNSASPEGGEYSRKNDDFRYFQAEGERAKILICEADPLVTAYFQQPHTLHFIGLDLPFKSYTPDVEIHRMDQAKEVAEIKYDQADACRDTKYVKKLLTAKWFYDRIGLKFVILTETGDLNPSVSLKNARIIATCKNDSLSIADLLRLSQHFRQTEGLSTIGAASSCLRGSADEHPALAKRKVLAGIARREIGADIHSRTVDEGTEIWLLAQSVGQS